MDCLYCGDCCRRMSPISTPEPCPHIIEIEKDNQHYVLCKIYEQRPEECRNHKFSTRICPIGISVMDLPTIASLHKRIDNGFELCMNHSKG